MDGFTVWPQNRRGDEDGVLTRVKANGRPVQVKGPDGLGPRRLDGDECEGHFRNVKMSKGIRYVCAPVFADVSSTEIPLLRHEGDVYVTVTASSTCYGDCLRRKPASSPSSPDSFFPAPPPRSRPPPRGPRAPPRGPAPNCSPGRRRALPAAPSSARASARHAAPPPRVAPTAGPALPRQPTVSSPSRWVAGPPAIAIAPLRRHGRALLVAAGALFLTLAVEHYNEKNRARKS
ncbi:hypothetical protein EJB05_31939, partial [Eragrostis curvula]